MNTSHCICVHSMFTMVISATVSIDAVCCKKVKGAPERRCRLAWKRRNWAHISNRRLWLVGLSIFMQQKWFCTCKFELLLAQWWWFALYQWKAEKDWLMVCCSLLSDALVFFTMSQTARHKTAALTAKFFATFKCRFSETRPLAVSWKEKNCCECTYYSIPMVRASDASLLRNTFMQL